MKSLSIITPSTRLDGLRALVESADGTKWQKNDEWFVVADTQHPVGGIREYVESLGHPFRYMEHAGGVSGAEQRNLGIENARLGNYLVWLDDDNFLEPEGLNTIRTHLPLAPGPVQFEITWYGKHRSLSPLDTFPYTEDMGMELAGGGQQFVTPNLPGKVASWPNNGCCDYYFVRDTILLWGGVQNVKQVAMVIAHAW